MADSNEMGMPPRRTAAVTRKSRWPGWIWAVPIAAVGIVAWLLVRAFTERGIDITVTFADAAEMKPKDTKVRYRGLDVGRVSSVELASDRRHVVAHLDVDDVLTKDLNTGTRFYLQGAQPSLSDPSSLKAMVTGPSILILPGEGTPTRHFSGIAGPPPETFAVTLPYVANFEGDVGRLKPGSDVTFRGFTVGKVTDISLSTDARTGQVSTPVVIALDPTRFHIHGLGEPRSDWAGMMRVTLSALVERGLRARLTESPPLIGSEQVELALVPDAPRAQLRMTAALLEIPTQPGGLASLPAQIGHLPLSQIAENVRSITTRLNDLTGSPRLQDSLRHLDAALAELDHTVKAVGPQMGPTVTSIRETTERLRHSADDIDGTAQAARKLLGGSASSPNGNLEEAVHELTGTARSIRVLANYLDQHPEALVRGRAVNEARDR